MSGARPLAVCALVVGAVLVPTGSADAQPYRTVTKTKQPSPMVTKINQFRRAHGLPALVYSRSLSRSSYRYAGHLARIGRVGHTMPTGTARFSSVAEVLAWHPGWELLRDATLRAWARSGGHRAVLLNPRFRYIGAGRARGQLSRSPATVWVVRLGA
jgi:uncharacterized protein YkwD